MVMGQHRLIFASSGSGVVDLKGDFSSAYFILFFFLYSLSLRLLSVQPSLPIVRFFDDVSCSF